LRQWESKLDQEVPMLSEDEQLETWWESLSPDQQSAVLDVAPDADPPGWMVASLAAANVFLADTSETGGAEDIKFHVPQAIQEFAARKRGEQ
jgi:hypothetical protein